jgi:hypothetical protein
MNDLKTRYETLLEKKYTRTSCLPRPKGVVGGTYCDTPIGIYTPEWWRVGRVQYLSKHPQQQQPSESKMLARDLIRLEEQDRVLDMFRKLIAWEKDSRRKQVAQEYLEELMGMMKSSFKSDSTGTR